MKEWRKVIVSKETSIRDVVEVIDRGALRIALVVGVDNRLIGTVTDGDVRRGILRGVSFDAPVQEIMFKEPTTVSNEVGREQILHLFQEKGLHQIPVVDSGGNVVGLEVIDALIKPTQRDNWVVIMAGGKGSRLRPFTENCPKPMLKVGGKPILETILCNFIEYGFTKFFFSVNYKSDVIRAYFGDGSAWNCEINYIHEDQPLGTAGSLSLLPPSPEHPLIVMNGDVLTKVDFTQLLIFHSKHKSLATMCVREFDMQVPYGVVLAEQERFKGIEEKPVQKFFVNAGIYLLEPEVLNHIPEKQKFDMPSLFDLLQSKGLVSTVFPVMEYWVDLGHIDELKKAQEVYGEMFK